MLVQIGVVGDVGGDAFAGHRVALHRMAVYQNLALGEIQHPDHGADGGGFAGAVLA